MDVMARFHLLPMQAFELLLLFICGVSMTASTTSKIYSNVSIHSKFIYIGRDMHFSLYLNRVWAFSSRLRLVGNAYSRWDYLQSAYKWTFGNSRDFIEQFCKKLKRGLSFESIAVYAGSVKKHELIFRHDTTLASET